MRPSLLSAPDRRALLRGLLAAPLVLAAPRLALSSGFGNDLARARAKVTAYVELIDATQPVIAMWRRYTNLVNIETGPTGREVRINGLMPPPDVRRELDAARAALASGPAFAECDPALHAFAALHDETMALVAEAAAYYERAVQREDGGEAARAYHARLRKAVPAWTDARSAVRQTLEPIRGIVEQAELAALERAHGRDGRWHIRRATVEARKVMAVFPRAGGVIEVERLDAALADYDKIVEELEAFDKAHPQAMLFFASGPRTFAAGLRRARERILAFPATPKRWAPEIADVETPFQSLASLADTMLRNLA